MKVGPENSYPTKADIRTAILDETGHYPRQGEFDKALDDLLKYKNTYKFGYVCGTGWFKSKTGAPFKFRYKSGISSLNKKTNQLNIF